MRLVVAFMLLSTDEGGCDEKIAKMAAARAVLLACLEAGNDCADELVGARVTSEAAEGCEGAFVADDASAQHEPPPANDVRWGAVEGFLGVKSLSRADWDPVATQTAVGVVGTIGDPSWPILAAADLHVSLGRGHAQGARIVGSTSELCIGIRRVLEFKPAMRSDVSAGLAMTNISNLATFSGDARERASGNALGYWLGAGISHHSGFRLVGFRVRYSAASIDVGPKSVRAGGIHAGLTIGFGGRARQRNE